MLRSKGLTSTDLVEPFVHREESGEETMLSMLVI